MVKKPKNRDFDPVVPISGRVNIKFFNCYGLKFLEEEFFIEEGFTFLRDITYLSGSKLSYSRYEYIRFLIIFLLFFIKILSNVSRGLNVVA